jgi:putative transposase
LLKREGIEISGSTVGREMNKPKARGLLVEPENVRQAKLARKRRRKPRYAMRKPKGYKVTAPGDLVQIDTLRTRLIPNEERFQFSAWDQISKLVGIKAYKRQTSTAAADFLHHLKTKFPFRIKAIQIDGGSEFMDQFEEACRRKKIRLFVNPPRCPQINGGVERSNRTLREEFYEVEDVSLNVEEHNQQLDSWAYTNNYIRPHRALDMATPYEYYLLWKKSHKSQVSRMP